MSVICVVTEDLDNSWACIILLHAYIVIVTVPVRGLWVTYFIVDRLRNTGVSEYCGTEGVTLGTG